jgi:hypothetical protein
LDGLLLVVLFFFSLESLFLSGEFFSASDLEGDEGDGFLVFGVVQGIMDEDLAGKEFDVVEDVLLLCWLLCWEDVPMDIGCALLPFDSVAALLHISSRIEEVSRSDDDIG